jgi:hypothetical protein
MPAILLLLAIILLRILLLLILVLLLALPRLHIRHKDIFGVLLVDEYVRFHKFDALIMDRDIHVEIATQKLKQLLALYEGIKRVSPPGEYEQRPEEINEDGVHERVVVDGLLYGDAALAEHSEELHDQLLKLKIVEHLCVVLLVKDELELVIVDQLLDPSDIPLEVHVLQLEAQLQVLVVKHPNARLRVVRKVLYHTRRVDQVVFEKGGKERGVRE